MLLALLRGRRVVVLKRVRGACHLAAQAVFFVVRVHVKVEHQQLGLLGAVTATNSAHQSCVCCPDAPNYTAGTTTVQRDQVADKIA